MGGEDLKNGGIGDLLEKRGGFWFWLRPSVWGDV